MSRSSIRSGLQDGSQRRACDTFIAKQDADTKLTIGKHVAAQQGVFQNQAAAGQIVSFKQQAAALYDGDPAPSRRWCFNTGRVTAKVRPVLICSPL
jgi:hypothetical protein